MKKNEKLWWTVSLMVSAALIAALVMLWSNMNQYDVRSTTQLVDAKAVDSNLSDHWIHTSKAQSASEPLRTLKTRNKPMVNLKIGSVVCH